MNRFVVVTDSTANLPPELVSEYDIPMIPLTVHWGEETYLDGVSLDVSTNGCRNAKRSPQRRSLPPERLSNSS